MHVINSGIRDVKFGENVKVVMPVGDAANLLI